MRKEKRLACTFHINLHLDSSSRCAYLSKTRSFLGLRGPFSVSCVVIAKQKKYKSRHLSTRQVKPKQANYIGLKLLGIVGCRFDCVMSLNNCFQRGTFNCQVICSRSSVLIQIIFTCKSYKDIRSSAQSALHVFDDRKVIPLFF